MHKTNAILSRVQQLEVMSFFPTHHFYSYHFYRYHTDDNHLS